MSIKREMLRVTKTTVELHPDAEKLRRYLSYDKAEATAYNYSLNVDRFLKWVDKPTETLEPSDITDWYHSLEEDGYSPRSIFRFGWALRSFFDVMGMQEMKRQTPIMKYEVPDPKWLPKDKAMEVISDDPVLSVGYDLALRVGEVGLLRKSRYNQENGKIEVTRLKHKGQRNTYLLELSPWCLEVLNRYLGVLPALDDVRGDGSQRLLDDVMFPMRVSAIQKLFNALAYAAGLEGYTFHCLRHSRITHIALQQLEERGVVDELSLSKFAGHLRVETTRTYVHLATRYLAFKS